MGGGPNGIGDYVELIVARAIGRNLTPIQGCAVQIFALVVFAFVVWALFASGLIIRIIDPFVQWYTSQMHSGHVSGARPILNVQYLVGAPGGCGPTYRDWQNSENCFEANGVDVTPGFRVCSSPASTILDSGSDAGNFRGVAIYVQGQDVVLVSELTAGWYRYVSEWRLRSDGTIRPRFGFAATDNPCTCSEHIHHACWRFDFDIRTSWNNKVEEYNDPPLVGISNWHTKSYEIRRSRDASRQRRWKVSNAASGVGYVLEPGIGDGAADAYGVGDVWVLRYRGSELDDGQGFTTDPARSRRIWTRSSCRRSPLRERTSSCGTRAISGMTRRTPPGTVWDRSCVPRTGRSRRDAAVTLDA